LNKAWRVRGIDKAWFVGKNKNQNPFMRFDKVKIKTKTLL
jgi:hypothetical protein